MNVKFVMIGIILLITALSIGYDQIFTAKHFSVTGIKQEAGLDPSKWARVPSITFTGLDSQSFTSEDLRGKVVILIFWATWCPSCIQEIPTLLWLSQKYKDDLVLVAISADERKEDMEHFFSKLQPEFASELSRVRMVWDPERKITTGIFGTVRLPEAIVVSREGLMARKIVGAADWKDPRLINFIDSLLKLGIE